jgi:hypothetical protein
VNLLIKTQKRHIKLEELSLKLQNLHIEIGLSTRSSLTNSRDEWAFIYFDFKDFLLYWCKHVEMKTTKFMSIVWKILWSRGIKCMSFGIRCQMTHILLKPPTRSK